MEKRTMVFWMSLALVATFFLSFYSVEKIGDITGKAVSEVEDFSAINSGVLIIEFVFVLSVVICVIYYLQKSRLQKTAFELNRMNAQWWNPLTKAPYH